LDCGGTTPLSLHFPLVPDALEFTPLSASPRTRGEGGGRPAKVRFMERERQGQFLRAVGPWTTRLERRSL